MALDCWNLIDGQPSIKNIEIFHRNSSSIGSLKLLLSSSKMCFARASLYFSTQFHTLYLLVEINPLSANPTKWSNTLKQFVGSLPTNCLSLFNQFLRVGA